MAVANKEHSQRSSFQQYVGSTKFLIVAVAIAVIAGFGIMYSVARHNSSPVSSVCTVSACVPLSKYQTEPQVVTVKNGGYVQFNSADGEKHNVMLASSGAHHGESHDDMNHYSSGEFAANEGWKVQFKQDGTYSFTDMNNDKIKISVVVYTPGKDYKIN